MSEHLVIRAGWWSPTDGPRAAIENQEGDRAFLALISFDNRHRTAEGQSAPVRVVDPTTPLCGGNLHLISE